MDMIKELILDKSFFYYLYSVTEIDEIELSSVYSNQTKEYTNEVIITYNDTVSGHIPMKIWDEVKRIVQYDIDKNSYLKDYYINTTKNQLVLIYDTEFPISF